MELYQRRRRRSNCDSFKTKQYASQFEVSDFTTTVFEKGIKKSSLWHNNVGEGLNAAIIYSLFGSESLKELK